MSDVGDECIWGAKLVSDYEMGAVRRTWIDVHLTSEMIYGLAKFHAVTLL
jgi:hypothetical protein